MKEYDDIPEDLEEIILSCLSKDRDKRPQSANQLALQLSQCACAANWDAQKAEAWWVASVPKKFTSSNSKECFTKTIVV